MGCQRMRDGRAKPPVTVIYSKDLLTRAHPRSNSGPRPRCVADSWDGHKLERARMGARKARALSADCVADDAVSCEPVSAFRFPANREINREFCKIGSIRRNFVSDQRAHSMPYSGIPCATEQGIFKCVSGNFFRGTGKFNQVRARRCNCSPTPSCG
jgi:hypothetical protein